MTFELQADNPCSGCTLITNAPGPALKGWKKLSKSESIDLGLSQFQKDSSLHLRKYVQYSGHFSFIIQDCYCHFNHFLLLPKSPLQSVIVAYVCLCFRSILEMVCIKQLLLKHFRIKTLSGILMSFICTLH